MGGGREVQEGGGICTPTADSCFFVTRHKPAQYCKAVIHKLK